MKLVLVAFLVCVFATLARCQFGFGFDGGLDAPFQPRARDPRQNRGPVVFPQAPDNGETSGVIVGASGYGFVPPNDAGRQYQGFFGPFF